MVVTENNRRFINAVMWILRTGAPWRYLPEDYGDWKNTHRRLSRWRDKGQWENILKQLMKDPDFEWLMIDASHGSHKRGRNTKIHLAVDAHGIPVRVIITAGAVADCTQAGELIEGIEAQHLLADKGCDANAIIEQAQNAGMQTVIPPKGNRKEPRDNDQYLYKLRHLVENAFLKLNQWRGIATRYAKRSASYLAAVQFHCAILWARIS